MFYGYELHVLITNNIAYALTGLFTCHDAEKGKLVTVQ